MKIQNPFSKPTTQTNLTSGEDGSVVSKTPHQSTTMQSSSKVEQQIETLVPGQTLQGEVVAKNGKEITLKVAGDMVLTARLERELNLELGKLLTFQVKNNGKILSLSPLFANMSMDKTAYKALEMANIPINERNAHMATSMMEKGMSVDVNSIQNVYKDVATFGTATVEHILRLHQMGIPVNAQNLNQLIHYENLEHQLVAGMSQVVSDLQAEGLDQPALSMVLETLDTNSDESSLVSKVMNFHELQVLADGIKQLTNGMELPDKVVFFVEHPGQSDLTVKDLLLILSQMPDTNGITGKETGQQTAIPISMAEVGLEGNSALNTDNLVSQPNTNASESASATAIAMGIETATVPSLEKGFLEGEVFGKLLNAHLLDSWALNPQEVADKGRIRDLYDQISRQLEGLKMVLEHVKGEESTALKTVNNLQNNVNFMNHINQLYTYIQIPLNRNGKGTQGELYVYTNKKNLARNDGTVSALLHLDMEHLGPVDVYVAMQNQKVTTNFYLATDELLDFIHEHIYILDEHLAKRGYSLNCQMIQRDEETGQGFNVIEEIAKEEPDKVVLSQYAFDVRA
ncbi:MAG: flagellar hook-length control protein FliK [Lachnospiraceae bacterium]|nr:flagellar hook-length control protein FliK [Lachnospiraceae bacterium]